MKFPCERLAGGAYLFGLFGDLHGFHLTAFSNKVDHMCFRMDQFGTTCLRNKKDSVKFPISNTRSTAVSPKPPPPYGCALLDCPKEVPVAADGGETGMRHGNQPGSQWQQKPR